MLKSLNNILGAVENQPQWEGPKQFQHLLQCWAEVVGRAAAQETRPHSISRDVLYVATSGSAWAQDLKFRRRSILKKLNARLSTPLTDIHFSTAHWQAATENEESTLSSSVWLHHPSHVVETAPSSQGEQVVKHKDSRSAFQHWAEVMQQRSHNLPLCPRCQCPTPVGELERWAVCRLCAVKQWQDKPLSRDKC